MPARKNILFIANRVPFPPNKGDKIRTFHQLDHLALTNNVYCASFVESTREQAFATSLRRWCADLVALSWRRRRGLFRAAAGWRRGLPLTVGAYQDRRMYTAIARWAERVNFDAAVAFSSSMAPYALATPAKRHVLDLCDADSEKWNDYARDSGRLLGAGYRAEGRRLRAFEEDCLRKFDATLVITERERALLDPRRHCRNLHVVANGVVLPDETSPPPSACSPIIGFVGAMDYRPNVRGICWFVEVAWPHILREMPDARLHIIGRAPTREVRRLARASGVTVTGEVEDVRKQVLKLRVAIAPLHIARGLQNKVLEAMSLRRPVVTTPTVAAGLQVVPGRHLLVARDGEGFAAHVLDLCRSDELCDQIGDAGYRCVAANYSWADVLQRYESAVLGRPMPVLPPTILEQELRQIRWSRALTAPSRPAAAPVRAEVTPPESALPKAATPRPEVIAADPPLTTSRTIADLAASFAASASDRNGAPRSKAIPPSSGNQPPPERPSTRPRSPFAALFRGDRPAE